MAALKIPAEWADKLEVVDKVDERPFEEILQKLNQHVPVTSEKNIWSFWHSGVRNMPGWCQRNVVDWVRICGAGWTVRVLDNVPDSPNYALNYVSADDLPDAFVQHKMDGPFAGQHSADMVRGATIYEHGGAWMDVGSIMTRDMDRFCWNELEDPSSPYQVAMLVAYGNMMMNFFIAAHKRDPFIQRWHQLFMHLWKGRTNHVGLIDNPLLSFAKGFSFEQAESTGITMDWAVPPVTIMEYIAQSIAWVRLTMLEEASDGFSCVDYWMNNVLVLDCSTEAWPLEMVLGFDSGGDMQHELLSLRLDGDKTSEMYKRAETLVYSSLSNSSMIKISRGGKTAIKHRLGLVWDKPENAGADHADGTFAGLLRFGTINFRQTRQNVVKVEVQRPQMTMKKEVLEP